MYNEDIFMFNLRYLFYFKYVLQNCYFYINIYNGVNSELLNSVKFTRSITIISQFSQTECIITLLKECVILKFTAQFSHC